jgi:hypothetical protein
VGLAATHLTDADAHTRIGHACMHWVACTDTQAHTGTHPKHQHPYPHAHLHANADTHTYAHTPLGLGGAVGLRLRLYGSAAALNTFGK